MRTTFAQWFGSPAEKWQGSYQVAKPLRCGNWLQDEVQAVEDCLCELNEPIGEWVTVVAATDPAAADVFHAPGVFHRRVQGEVSGG